MNIDAYVPAPRALEVAGKTVVCAPLKVRQIPPFTRAIAPAMQTVFAGDLFGAVAQHGEALIEAVAVATGEPEDWLGELDAEAFLRLFSAVLEVNADFFVHRLRPAISETATMLAARLTPGETPSPCSSPAESAGTTAST